MFQKLRNKIEQRNKKGTMRSLSLYDGMIDFMSNDFLGLGKFETPSIGKPASGGSRLMTGNTARLEQIETEIAQFLGVDHGLLFNSGYQANLAIFSCIPDKRTLVLYDKEIHASVRDGLRMSDGKAIGFRHNDLDDLERLLHKASVENEFDSLLVAVEALFSMSGELSPLKKIAELCQTYNAHLIVDEAHSAGVYGKEGKGLVEELALNDKVAIRLVTFGKAFGAHGAIVLSNDPVIREYLINFARPLIYTTAISEHEANRILSNIKNNEGDILRDTLKKKIHFFRGNIPFEPISDERSPIQVIRSSMKELDRLEKNLKSNNIAAKIIVEPTVPKGKECLRIVIHAFNTEKEMELLLLSLEQ